jgi:hypothetical protein
MPDTLAWMARSFLHDNSGVSVIIGAMLLILITIVAAAGLALIVSQSEKQAADRQALQSAIDNEKLKIASISITSGSNGLITHIKVDIMNLNTEDSKLIAISVNGYYAKDFTNEDGSKTYDINNPMVIKGGRDAIVELNLEDPGHFIVTSPDPPQLAISNSVKIELTTSYINYFSRVYTPPIASAKINVGTENLPTGTGSSTTYRDYLVLDGSDSSSLNGSILSWDWTVQDQNGDYAYYFNGRIVRAKLSSTGPFTITLKVTDDSKLVGTSTIQVPADQNFDQLGTYNVFLDPSDNIIVNLIDIYNNFMGGVKVTYQPEDPVNGPKYTPSYAYTDQYGYAKLTHIAGTGKVNVTIASIVNGSNPPPVSLTVS